MLVVVGIPVFSLILFFFLAYLALFYFELVFAKGSGIIFPSGIWQLGSLFYCGPILSPAKGVHRNFSSKQIIEGQFIFLLLVNPTRMIQVLKLNREVGFKGISTLHGWDDLVNFLMPSFLST